MGTNDCHATGDTPCQPVAGPRVAGRGSATRTRWWPGSSLRKGASLAGAEFFQGFLAKPVEFARTNISLDLLVPQLGLVFPEPTAKLEDFRWREILNLIKIGRAHV